MTVCTSIDKKHFQRETDAKHECVSSVEYLLISENSDYERFFISRWLAKRPYLLTDYSIRIRNPCSTGRRTIEKGLNINK